jgi:hypothetical protein
MKKIIYGLGLTLAIFTIGCSEDSNEQTNTSNPVQSKTLEVNSTTGVDYYNNIEIYVNGKKANRKNKTEITPYATVKSGDAVRFKTRIGPGILIENIIGAKLTIVYRVNHENWSAPLSITEYTNDLDTWYFKDANENDEIIIP